MPTTYENTGPRERVAPVSQFQEELSQPVGKGEPRSAGTGVPQGGGTFELYPGAGAQKQNGKQADPEEEETEEAPAETETTSVDMPRTAERAVKPTPKAKSKK